MKEFARKILIEIAFYIFIFFSMIASFITYRYPYQINLFYQNLTPIFSICISSLYIYHSVYIYFYIYTFLPLYLFRIYISFISLSLSIYDFRCKFFCVCIFSYYMFLSCIYFYLCILFNLFISLYVCLFVSPFSLYLYLLYVDISLCVYHIVCISLYI